MGKDGFLTPKAIANRIKAKGLQKLKFYCQMCQKQCRDANGFKCHKESEGHQRMMLLFAEDANKYVHDFSDEVRTKGGDGHREGREESRKIFCRSKRPSKFNDHP